MALIYVYSTVVTASGAISAGALLSASERSRIAQCRLKSEWCRRAIGWALVRIALADVTGRELRDLAFSRLCFWCGDRGHGKPHMVGKSKVDFNLSHSEDLAVVAISKEHAVGIDIESRLHNLAGCADQILAPGETPVDSELIELWVRKEAVLKAEGLGLKVRMASFNLGALRRAYGISSLSLPGMERKRYASAVAAAGLLEFEIISKEVTINDEGFVVLPSAI